MKAIETCPKTKSNSTPVGAILAKPKKPSKKAKATSELTTVKAKVEQPATSQKKKEAKSKPDKKPRKKKADADTAAMSSKPNTTAVVYVAPSSSQIEPWQASAVELGRLVEFIVGPVETITTELANEVIEAARKRYAEIVSKAKALQALLASDGVTVPAEARSPSATIPGHPATTGEDTAGDLPPEPPRPRMAAIFDTETTGLIRTRQIPLDKLPEVIEFYGELVDLDTGKVQDQFEALIKPRKLPLTDEIVRITGITTDMLAKELGFNHYVYDINKLFQQADCVIAHNLKFDMEMLEIESERTGKPIILPDIRICTVEKSMSLKRYRLNLSGLHQELFGEPFAGAHRAKADVQALTRCTIELRKRGLL